IAEAFVGDEVAKPVIRLGVDDDRSARVGRARDIGHLYRIAAAARVSLDFALERYGAAQPLRVGPRIPGNGDAIRLSDEVGDRRGGPAASKQDGKYERARHEGPKRLRGCYRFGPAQASVDPSPISPYI